MAWHTPRIRFSLRVRIGIRVRVSARVRVRTIIRDQVGLRLRLRIRIRIRIAIMSGGWARVTARARVGSRDRPHICAGGVMVMHPGIDLI